MCRVIASDIGRDTVCLDERRFVLIISASLDATARSAAARRAFAEAGMQQDDRGVTCLCGLEAHMPSSRLGSFARILASVASLTVRTSYYHSRASSAGH